MAIFDIHKQKLDREGSEIHSAERRQWFTSVFLPELHRRLHEKGIQAEFRIVGSVSDGTAGSDSDIDVRMYKEQSSTVDFELIFPLVRQVVYEMQESGYSNYTVQLWNAYDTSLRAHAMFRKD